MLEGAIDRSAYIEAIDALYPQIPKNLRADVDRRRDRRTLGEFALHIYDSTAREAFLVREWAALLYGLGLRLVDNGVGNSGRLVLDTAGRGGEPDFVLRFPERSYRLEVKFGPTPRFVTYKVDDLVNYTQRDDTVVLTILGDGRDPTVATQSAVPAGLYWFLMDRARIRRLLSRGEIGTHKGFGGKETVRLEASRFEDVFGGLRAWEEKEPMDLLIGC